MLYRITLAVDVEADSLTEATNAANAPLVKEIADRMRRAGLNSESSHVTRSEVTAGEKL